MTPEPVLIARCPEHGLHGERTECCVCGGQVEQVPMIPLNECVHMLRAHATQLHRIAANLADEAAALERAFPPRLLGGRELAAAAVDVLAGFPDGIHYRDLLSLIEATTGRRVSGVKPQATLLANIDRDPRIRSTGRRTGCYALAAGGLR